MRLSIIGLFIVTLSLAYEISESKKQIKELRTDLLELSQAQVNFDDRTVSRERSLQDSLEERIGTIEHDLDQIIFLMGKQGPRK